MELLVLVILLSLMAIALSMMVIAFVVWKRSPAALWLMKAGAYLAAGASLLILAIPGAVPWWEYDPASYWSRLVIGVIPVFCYIILTRAERRSIAQRNNR